MKTVGFDDARCHLTFKKYRWHYLKVFKNKLGAPGWLSWERMQVLISGCKLKFHAGYRDYLKVKIFKKYR